ncbi:MAG: SpoIID/LytB domain-containing protein [Firmicutes bacterium]|nr:SpoIID/LytB domain-containing protein [Bacillota bacterium]
MRSFWGKSPRLRRFGNLHRFGKPATLMALILVMVLTAGAGCRLFKRPVPAAKPPQIPKAVRVGDRAEPEITVYMADTGGTKKMRMEDYIEGVVAAEMDPDWPIEALAAQAIIARTFTLQQIETNGGVPDRKAHASTSKDEFQAYDSGRVNARVKKAVEITRGKVIGYNGKLARSLFSAYDGGISATLEEAGFEGKEPYLTVVKSPDSGTIPDEVRNWKASFPVSEVRSKVKALTGKDPGAVGKVSVVKKGPSGRALSVQVGDARITGPQLRLALGPDRLKSVLLSQAKVSGNKVEFAGRGYGHGVGLSQWGAKVQADRGKKAEQIVRTYYKGASVFTIWD